MFENVLFCEVFANALIQLVARVYAYLLNGNLFSQNECYVIIANGLLNRSMELRYFILICQPTSSL